MKGFLSSVCTLCDINTEFVFGFEIRTDTSIDCLPRVSLTFHLIFCNQKSSKYRSNIESAHVHSAGAFFYAPWVVVTSWGQQERTTSAAWFPLTRLNIGDAGQERKNQLIRDDVTLSLSHPISERYTRCAPLDHPPIVSLLWLKTLISRPRITANNQL